MPPPLPPDDAVESLRAALGDRRRAPYVVQADALLRVERGDARAGLERVAKCDVAQLDAHLTFHIAEVYATAGEIDRGLDVLALAAEKGFTPIPFIVTHCPFIEPLRGHDRFAAIAADARARSAKIRGSVVVAAPILGILREP